MQIKIQSVSIEFLVSLHLSVVFPLSIDWRASKKKNWRGKSSVVQWKRAWEIQKTEMHESFSTSTSNTHLHIAALLGHAEFAMVVMQCCPHLPLLVFLLIRHVHASFKETIYTQPR